MDYGICTCGGNLHPIYFREEETRVEYGCIVETGRFRMAVSHLVCENCLRNFTIDDSFDGPWMMGRCQV